MISPPVDKRKIGLNFSHDGNASIMIWAPNASHVEIEIVGKNRFSLDKRDLGYWGKKNLEIKPNDKYWLVIDKIKRLPDPWSLSQPDGVHGPSEAISLYNFVWTDQPWKGTSVSKLIIYEIHTGTFSEAGTFEGIMEKLGYLKELGITAIELMPVSQFPGKRNWGYDGVYPFAVQENYGGSDGLMKLVDVCHQKQLAVILDVVYNHLGPEGNYLPSFGPWLTDKYKIPWGLAINFDDAWCDGIRDLCIENTLMWFRDFHIDGLRLDAIHAIKDFSVKHILAELKEQTIDFNKLTDKNHFLIGECDLNDTKYISGFERGGYNLDAQWCDEFHHALHSLTTGEVDGYYSDFGSIEHLTKSYSDAYVYDGIFTPNRKKIFGNKTTGIPGHKFVVFSQNHDHIGNRMQGERLSTLVDFESLKLIAVAVFISPFTPLLFMGEEYGETAQFLFFTNHSDPKLIESLIQGRLDEFKSFKNLGEPKNPQDERTFLQSKLQWNYDQNKNQSQLLSFYKELIYLKKNNPILKNANRNNLNVNQVKDKNIIILRYSQEHSQLVSILNFEKTEVEINTSTYLSMDLNLILNSADEKWGGPSIQSALVKSDFFTLKPRTAIIFST